MAASTGIVLATGAITAANELIFAPVNTISKGGKVTQPFVDFNWRLIPATAGLALALAALEHLSRPFAVGLAWLALVTVLIVPIGNAPTPLDNATRLLQPGTRVLGQGSRKP